MNTTNYLEQNADSINISNQMREVSALDIPSSLSSSDEHDFKVQGEKIRDLMKIGFIRKVYGMLIIELIITLLISYIGLIPEVKIFYTAYPKLIYVYIGMAITLFLLLSIFKKLSKKVPINYILLSFFILSMSCIASYLFVLTDEWIIVFYIAVNLISILIGLLVITYYSKEHYNYLKSFITISIIGLVYIIISLFFINITKKYLIISVLIYVYSVYLFFNTRFLLEDNKDNEYSVDDYIIVSIRFYILDLIIVILYAITIIVQMLVRMNNYHY